MPSSLILDQVVALIEPLTRFDRSAVLLREESEQTLPCTGVWTSSFVISPSVSDGSGELPSGVRNASSQAGMERAIDEVIADERSHAVQRIQGWCAAQAQASASTHKPLTPGDCISGIARIGYAWQCSSCGGHGKTACSSCNGRGQVTCSQCQGTSRRKCSQCQGKGRRTCSSCGGHRGHNKQVEHRVFNSATNQYTVRYETVWENCGACQYGEVPCTACSGGGTVLCGCLSGKVNCSSCQGSGEKTCKSCNGTGTLHRIAETACQVTNTFAIRASDFDEEARQAMACWDFPLFCELAHVTSKAPTVTASELSRTYPATLSWTQARIQCAGQDLLLSGYGPQARVFDFKGIVGHLLANDLQQLRSTLELSRGFVPFRNQEVLRTSLSAMLQSELNQQLADSRQRAKLIANRTVTEEHATTTVECLSKAMSRLYGSVATIGLAALFVIAFFTLHRLLWSGYMLPGNRLFAAVFFLTVMAVTAVAAEVLCCHFLLKGFSRSGTAEGRQAASRLLRATGTLQRWRIAAALTIVVAIISFFAVTL